MANDLTTATDQQTAITTQWSPPSLTPKLTELLAATSIWTADGVVPAIDGEDRVSAELALATYERHPKGSSANWIERLLGTLATAFPASKLSEAEAKARLRLYTLSLEDIDIDILRRAVAASVKTCRFFPTVAELREIAERLPAPDRVWTMWKLRELLAAKPIAVIKSEDLADADEVRALIEGINARSVAKEPREPLHIPRGPSSLRKPEPFIPTAEDYAREFGMDVEQARAALADDIALMIGELVQSTTEGEAKQGKAA